jgi:phospholipase C
LPLHLDTHQPGGDCVADVSHAWTVQHACWNGGAMDRWASTHAAADGVATGSNTMGYYTRRDLPFYYALADAFTVADGYFCSVMGPTDPNRLYSLSATIDPAGKAGGPILDNPNGTITGAGGPLSWTTMPERLQTNGVSWKVYQFPPTGLIPVASNNVLSLFSQYQDRASELFRRAFLPTFPGDFQLDVLTGQLPQVSWVLAPPDMDEHPAGPSSYGEVVASLVLKSLVANRAVWSHTVLFLTYDENGGFFDHVVPPVAPPGTPEEFLTVSTPPATAGGVLGPIGLGFRVPLLVVSPFSRGGWVCSDTFDHTSLLRFIETRFGVEVPNLSAWRRSNTGDLTSTIDATTSDASVPPLPDAIGSGLQSTLRCGLLDAVLGAPAPTFPVPVLQNLPRQESGLRRRRA